MQYESEVKHYQAIRNRAFNAISKDRIILTDKKTFKSEILMRLYHNDNIEFVIIACIDNDARHYECAAYHTDNEIIFEAMTDSLNHAFEIMKQFNIDEYASSVYMK